LAFHFRHTPLVLLVPHVVDVQRDAVDRQDDVHLAVLPGDADEAVLGRVPVHGRARVHSRAVFLHDDRGHDVLERPVEPLQLFQDRVRHAIRPIPDFFRVVGAVAQGAHDGILGDGFNVLLGELVVLHRAASARGAALSRWR
ncbi:unnamed protein product, partial [Pelagomonas calceolata]